MELFQVELLEKLKLPQNRAKVWVWDGPVGRAKSCIGSLLDWWRWSLCVPLHLLHVGPANVLVSLFVGLAWPSF